MWDKSNCSVICTPFKITFLMEWDESGECPFLWPLVRFPDRHTYPVHSFQYYLSSCFEQFCWDGAASRRLQSYFSDSATIRPP